MTDEELDRIEALAQAATDLAAMPTHAWIRTDTGTTAEFLRAASKVTALVAEVRRMQREFVAATSAGNAHIRELAQSNASLRQEYDRMYAEREEFRLKAKGFKAERDALRAENERLRDACNGCPGKLVAP